jgi:hypothetical protein
MNRLQSLLRLRRHQENVADGVLAAVSRKRMQAEASRDALLRSDDMISVEPQPRALPELLVLRLQGVARQERVAEVEAAVEQRMREEVDARAARTAAAVRRRSVQRAVERRDHEQMVQAQRAARRALGELARLQAAQR